MQAKSECTKILDEFLVCSTWVEFNHLSPCPGSMWMYKNIRWVSGLQYLGGVQSSFTMSRLNLNVKILCEILVYSTWGGSIIFHYVQAESEHKKHFRWYSGLEYQGGVQSSFTMCKLNLKLKHFRWYSRLQYLGGGPSSFTTSRLHLNV